MKRAIKFLIVMLLTLSYTPAQCAYIEDVLKVKGKYIKDLYVLAIHTDHYPIFITYTIGNWLGKHGMIHDPSQTNGPAVMANLNRHNDSGDRVGDYYVYLFAEYTDDIEEAITDVMIVKRPAHDYSYSGDSDRHSFTYNGRNYQAAQYSERGDFTERLYNKDITLDTHSGGGNLNRGTGPDKENLYIYYTHDVNLNNRKSIVPGRSVIKNLQLNYKSNSTSDTRYVKYYNPDTGQEEGYADCASSLGGDWIYIKKEIHEHRSVGNGPALELCDCGLAADDYTEPQRDADGTYLIGSASNLCWWRDHVNNDYFHTSSARLTANIDLANIANSRTNIPGTGLWEPIGTDSWEGTFDGQGHVIRNFTYNSVGQTDRYHHPAGLFGSVGRWVGTPYTVIKNLTMDSVKIYSTHHSAAAFASRVKGYVKFQNCAVSGTIQTLKYGAAGFANAINTTSDGSWIDVHFESCTNTSTVIPGAGYASAGFICSADIENFNPRASFFCSVNKGQVNYAFTPNINGRFDNCLNIYPGIPFFEALTTSADSITSNLNVGHDRIANTQYSLADDNQHHNYALTTGQPQGGLKTAEQLASGEVCYLLNKESSADDVVWQQSLEAEGEAYPTPTYNPDNLLRIVYHYDKNQTLPEPIRCIHGYTNYRYYAEDNNGGGHLWEYQAENQENSNHNLTVNATCLICGATLQMNALKEKEEIILKPSCVAPGVLLKTFRLPDMYGGKVFYVKENLPHEGNSFLHIGNKLSPNYIEVNGVRKALGQCSQCGSVWPVNQFVEISEDNGWQIFGPYDLLAYFEECYKCMENDTDAPKATLYRDINMTGINIFESKWFALDSQRSWKNSTFDGQGHTIWGLYFDDSRLNSYHTGLFGNIDNGTVRDLTVNGVALGVNSALICRTATNSTFENVTVRGTVQGFSTAAGFCHEEIGSTFTNCRNYAQIELMKRSLSNIYAGGIVSKGNGGRFDKCTNHALIDGRSGTYIGGLAGSQIGAFVIRDCANYGKVIGREYIGGLVGAFSIINNELDGVYSSYTKNSLNTGDVHLTSKNHLKGGISGFFDIPAIDGEAVQMMLQDSYYRGAQAVIGLAEDGLALSMELERYKCTSEQLASGDVRQKLNTDGSTTWCQNIGMESYPYPWGKKSEAPNLHFNNTSIYIEPNSTVQRLDLQPKAYSPTKIVDCYFETTVPFYAEEASYTRNATLRKNFYATLCLPFAFSDPRLKILQYDTFDPEDNTVYFSEVETTEANRPYIVCLRDNYENDEEPFVITTTDAHVLPLDEAKRNLTLDESREPGFIGTYKSDRIYGDIGYYGFSATYGDFRQADSDDGNPVYPFRAVFKGVSDEEASPRFVLMIDEDNTISGLPQTNVVEISEQNPVYDLSGQKVGTSLHGLRPGVYIVNGNKVYVR